jgi:hypothetical protein
MFSDGARTLRDHRIERGPGRVRQHRHAARDAARAPAPTRLEVRNSLVRVQRNSLVRVHLYRSRRGRPGPNAAARAVGPLQIGASTSGRQPEGCLAVRHWPDTHRAPASRVLPTGITAHSFPGNILGAPGSGARRGLRRDTVATRPGANQETSTEEPVGLLQNMPTRAKADRSDSLPALCDGPYPLRHPDDAAWHRIPGSAPGLGRDRQRDGRRGGGLE